MAQQANAVQEGIDQVRTAVRRADRQFRKIQRQVDTRRKRVEKELSGRRKQVEKELTGRRKAFERRAQRELRRLQRELRKQPLVKRAEAWQKVASQRLERGVNAVLDAIPLATRRDVARIDRKISALNRKLRELEKMPRASRAQA